MRIGIDVRLWNESGVGRYIRNLVYNLERMDKKNDYILFARPEDLGELKIKNSKFKIVQTDIKWHSFDEQFNFVNILNRQNLDLVHFPYHSAPIFYNKAFIITIHDLIPFRFETGNASTLPFPLYKIKFMAYKFVLSTLSKKAKKIISPSEFSRKEIVNVLGVDSSRVRVIPEGVDERLRKSDDFVRKNQFLYVGNAYPHKNLDTLIQVFSELPASELLLIGKEDFFYKRLKRKVKDLKLSNIKFMGYVSDSKLSELYAYSRALVIPSLMEGFGLPALEAMSNGCPLLVSDIPAHREICQNAAIYFDPRDNENLRSKIIGLSNLGQYRDRGYSRAKEFGWEKTARETLKIYESCASISSA